MRTLAYILLTLALVSCAFGQTASVSMTGDSATCAFGTVTIGDASAPCDIIVTNGTGASFTWRVWSNAVQQEYTLSLTSVDNASGGNTVYHLAAYPGNTGLGGRVFVVTGFTNPANNGTFTAVSNTSTTVTLNNASGAAETHSATAESQSNGTLMFDGDVYARVWGDVNGCVPNYINNGSPNPATWTLASGATCHILAYLVPSAATILSSHLYLKDASGNVLSTINVTGSGVVDTNTTVALPVGINADYSGTVMDTTYPGDGVCWQTPTTATQLTSALAASASETAARTICIPKGTTISGQFTLPSRVATSNYILIRSDNAGSLPAGIPSAGNRICVPNDLLGTGTPPTYKANCTAMAANMAKVSNSGGDASSTATFTVACGAHHYRFAGLEFTGGEQINSANLGCGDSIIVDHSYMHIDSSSTYNNINYFGGHLAVIDSWVGYDGAGQLQAIALADGATVSKIVNNEIIGTGNIISGGEIGRGIVVQPTDIEIRGNHIWRPMTWNRNCTTGSVANCNGVAWDGITRDIKAGIEFKEGQRILIIGNIFEQLFSGTYSPIEVTPGDQHGNNIFATVRDFTFVRNIARFTNWGLYLTGGPFTWSGLPTKRGYIKDHLSYSVCGSSWPNAWSAANGGSCSGVTADGTFGGMQGTRPTTSISNLTIEHITALDGDWAPYIGNASPSGALGWTDATNLILRNSIFSTGIHPNAANLDLSNNATLNGTANNAFGKNLLLEPVDNAFIVAGTSCTYAGGKFNFNWGTAGAWNSNWCWGGAQANANFIGTGSTPYLITPATTYSGWAADGTDPGVTSAVYTETACVAAGTCGASAAANPSVSPTSIDFGTQTVGTPSAPTTVTLTNNTSSSLTITSVALLTGTDFAITNHCSSPLASPGSCTVDVTCNPTSAAVKTDTLRFTDSGGNSPQDVALTCTGTTTPPVTPTASLSCTPSFVVIGNFFSCTPTVTNATLCSVTNVGPINCSGAFNFTPDTVSSFSLILTATGSGGSADATTVTVYTQKQPTQGRTPF